MLPGRSAGLQWARAVLLVLLTAALLVTVPLPVAATTIRYRGSVYRATDYARLREGGHTVSIQVAVAAFPDNRSQLERILADVLCTHVRFLDAEGNTLRAPAVGVRPEIGRAHEPTVPDPATTDPSGGDEQQHQHLYAPSPSPSPQEGVVTSPRAVASDGPDPHRQQHDFATKMRRVVTELISRSDIRTGDGGRSLSIVFAGTNSSIFGDADSVLIVPCLPFFIFEQVGRVGVQDLPQNCLTGDPFIFRRLPFVIPPSPEHVARSFFVTGKPIELPLSFPHLPRTAAAKQALERSLRVMEGYTCLHTRQAFVRGSSWNPHTGVYRFVPNRGGVQTLCYTPYPETLPLLKVKVLDSYEVAGPEGVSTDPPQIRAGLEFVGTIYGTNLSEHDTAVITDELCADFLTQNVFFAELLYSSASRVSFYGTFHRKGIYHVCYHREGSPSYIRVSTLLVDKSGEVHIDSDSPDVLVDQDVKLGQSASVTRLKVQDKGNLDLRHRSLNVTHFIWSGGTISGKGSINCTHYCKITTQGYETRELTVPLRNYAELIIDVQRLHMDRDGLLHNYGNLTMAVSSMGDDGISSVLSNLRRNIIRNDVGGVFRLVALDSRSFALLTTSVDLAGGTCIVSGKIRAGDFLQRPNATLRLRGGTELTLHDSHLSGDVHLEAGATLVLGEGCVLTSARLSGDGMVLVVDGNVYLDSATFAGNIVVVMSNSLRSARSRAEGSDDDTGGSDAALHKTTSSSVYSLSSVMSLEGAAAGADAPSSSPTAVPISVGVYGTILFEPGTFVVAAHVNFVTSSGLAKMLFGGTWVVEESTTSFAGNIILQSSNMALVYGHSGRAAEEAAPHPLTSSVFVAPNSTLYCIDLRFLLPPALPVPPVLEEGEQPQESVPTSASCMEQYLSTSEFVVVGGRILMMGCWGFPTGGSVSGSMEKLESPQDWEVLTRHVCPRIPPGVLPDLQPLCNRPTVPVPTVAGLAVMREMHVRGPAGFYLDILEIRNGVLRVTEPVHVVVNAAIHVRAGAVMEMQSAATITAPLVRVDGTLELRRAARSRIEGNLTIAPTGVVLVGTYGKLVPELLDLVHGSVHVGDDGHALLPAAGLNATAAGIQRAPSFLNGAGGVVGSIRGVGGGDAAGASEAETLDALRVRNTGALPASVPCPTELLYWMEERRVFYETFFSPVPYDPVPGALPLWAMAVAFVVSVLVALLTLKLQLRCLGSGFAGWLEDMRVPCPLRLTLTWSEFSYRSLNYLGLCSVVLTSVNNTLAAFHPALPVPVPFIYMLCVRSTRILMPHLHVPATRMLLMELISIGFALTAVATVLLRPRARNLTGYPQMVFEVVSTGCSFISKIYMLFHVPLLTSVMDGVACNTLLRRQPSCAAFVSTPMLLVSIAAYLCATVVVPWLTVTEQCATMPLALHVKANWVLLAVALQTVETASWKVCYDSPLLQVLSCLFFQLVRITAARLSTPTPFLNINRFFMCISSMPLVVYASILLYEVLLKFGLVSSCMQYDGAFKTLFAVCVLLFIVLFWMMVVKISPGSESCGDLKIDAIRRSIDQIHSRIRDLNQTIINAADTLERENTLNAIARLRIEHLEKQDRYHYETSRLLKRFMLGSHLREPERDVRSPLSPTIARLGSETSFGTPTAHSLASSGYSVSPTSANGGLLTVEEMETFSCGPALGKGSYGTVHLGMLTNGKLVAVKYINVALQSAEALAAVKSEVDMLRELSHPNIIRYYGAHTIEDTMLVFMEFAVGGSLTSIARKFTTLTEPVLQLYTYQILLGLRYLHSKEVAHRDIKGENILVDGYGVAKLADFGCSKSLANLANASEVGCATLVGSPYWMAPEVIRSETYGTKADIWSVGCTVVEMLNGGEPPWRQEFDNVYSAMFHVGSTNDIPQTPEDTTEQCRAFLARCFERDVTRRATAEELLHHPWIAAVASSTGGSGAGNSSTRASMSVSRQNTDSAVFDSFAAKPGHHRRW